MRDLINKNLSKDYQVNILDIKPNGPVWKVNTPQGRYCIKRTRQNPSHITWLAITIEMLISAGYPGLLPLIRNKSGYPYFEIDNNLYIVSRWLDGTTPLFTCKTHRIRIAQTYAQLHEIASSIRYDRTPHSRDWWSEYRKRAWFLETLKVKILQNKKNNRIDRIILDWLKHFQLQAQVAIEGLSNAGFETWIKQPEVSGFCHNDPAPRNIIIEKNWFLIDYELSGYDLYLRELTLLALRLLQANGWDRQIYEELLCSYQSQRKITAEEQKFLPFLLAFPQRFWRLCSQRFQEQLDWSERHFAAKLWEITNSEKTRLAFLCELIPELSELNKER